MNPWGYLRGVYPLYLKAIFHMDPQAESTQTFKSSRLIVKMRRFFIEKNNKKVLLLRLRNEKYTIPKNLWRLCEASRVSTSRVFEMSGSLKIKPWAENCSY